MAKKEEMAVEEIQPVEAEVKTEAKSEPSLKEGGEMKIKKPTKPRQMVSKETEVTKIDLSKVTKEDVTKEGNVTKVDLTPKEDVKEEPVVEVVEEQPKEEVKEETPVLEEITDEVKEEVKEEIVEAKADKLEEEVVEAIDNAQKTGEEVPENIQKVMDFMDDTGGSLDDYVKLNQDYDKLDSNQLLKEYYKQTKSHLDDEEISFLMEDQFSFDEEVDEERDVRRKKLALKEQVANAKTHLDGLKSKYYEEIKAGVKLTPDQQKAVEFFNRYNDEQKVTQEDHERKSNVFNNMTNDVFDKSFKGFEYNVGDKKYRLNVKDGEKVKSTQSDISNFVKKFLNDKNEMNDAAGYHRSLFTAMNADAVANHFYEQGKADAIKDSIARSKNVNMDPRQTHKTVEAGGMKVRAIAGKGSQEFKVKIRK